MSRKSSINKIKRDNSKSKNIEAALIMNLYEKGHSPITSHFTCMGLQEMDVISISKADYIYEYEVKISKSDFIADFKKPKHKLFTEKISVKNYIKEGVQEVWFYTPNYFYFVVPKDLVTIDMIPDYAGLIYVNELFGFDIIKKAPLLHKNKATQSFIRQIGHNLMCKLIFSKKN